MRIHNLLLKNIGPFLTQEIEFISENDNVEQPPVIIFTGENGTGKSIVLDAIRTLLKGVFSKIERDINSSDNFLIGSNLQFDTKRLFISCNIKDERGQYETDNIEVNKLFVSHLETIYKRNFIFDYWTSKLSSDKFSIKSVENINANTYLDESLTGIHKNVDVSRVIAFFDYLRDSKDPKEKEIGETMYDALVEVINLSIIEGSFSHVSRIGLTPIVKIQGREVSLEKLSSGNLYLIQRFISLLKQVYSICIHNIIPIRRWRETKGVLLIDEAENHLHPKWQKVFLRNILKLFPKLQLIVTTHSPFIVSSIDNVRVFVCEGEIDRSIILEETEYFAHSPIEEILRSPLFNTTSFNVDVSRLLEARKEAIKAQNASLKNEIEKQYLEHISKIPQ